MPTPSREPEPFEAGGYMNLALPPELVEAIARRTAELVSQRSDQADDADGRLALPLTDAADAIGVSVDHLRRHIMPELRTIRSGRLHLIPRSELARWIEENASRALGGR